MGNRRGPKVIYIQTQSNCCVIGYHGGTSSANGNGVQQVNTYIYAAYTDPGIFSMPIEDINLMTFNSSGNPGDPINIEFLGNDGQIRHHLRSAGWYRADEIRFITSVCICVGSVEEMTIRSQTYVRSSQEEGHGTADLLS